MGDLLAPILTEKLFDAHVITVYGKDAHQYPNTPLLAGLGSMLANFQDLEVHVWGAGYESGYTLPRYGGRQLQRERWQIHALRGPLTQMLLRAPRDVVLGDPALLVPRIYEPNTMATETQRYFLHCFNPANDNPDNPLPMVSTAQAPFPVIDAIVHSDFVFTEALHVAVIAHAFDIPWAWSFNRHRIGVFKWLDWFASLQLEPVNFHYSEPLAARQWAETARRNAVTPDPDQLFAAFPRDLLA